MRSYWKSEILRRVPSCHGGRVRIAALVGAVSALGSSAYGVSGQYNATTSGNWGDSVNWLNGIIADGSNSQANFNAAITAATTVTVTPSTVGGTTRLIGSLRFNDTDTTASPGGGTNSWTLAPDAGGTTITLDTTSGLPLINANNGTPVISAVIAGTKGFQKLGTTVQLSGANTVSGPIHVTEGTLQLRGANGTMLNASSIRLTDSIFELFNNLAGGNNTNRIADNTPLLMHGGQFTLFNAPADATVSPPAAVPASETIGAVTYSGGSQLRVDNNGVAPVSVVLTVNGAVTRNDSISTIRFISGGNPASGAVALGTDLKIIATNQAASTFIGGWAFASTAASAFDFSSDFAQYDATNGFSAIPAAGRIGDLSAAGSPGVADNVRITSTTPTAMDADRTINSLALASATSAAAGTVTQSLGGFTLNLASGGLVRGSRNASSGADTFTLSSGNLTAGSTSSPANLYVDVEQAGSGFTNNLVISANIVNNSAGGAVTFIKTGNGVLSLSGVNTNSGGFVFQQGTNSAIFGATGSPLGTGQVRMSGGTLQLRSDTTPQTLTSNNLIIDGNEVTINAGHVTGNTTSSPTGNVVFNFGGLSFVNNVAGPPNLRLNVNTNAASFNTTTNNPDAAQFTFAGQTVLGAPGVIINNAPASGTATRTTVISLTGGISDGGGGFSLSKEGAGTLNISGTAATFTGGFNAGGGTVGVSSANVLGTGPLAVTAGTANLTAAQSMSAITVSGGTLNGTVANAFGTGLNVAQSAGTIIATNASTFGGGSLTMSGGTFAPRNNASTSFSTPIVLNGNATILPGRTSSGASVSHTLGTLTINSNGLTPVSATTLTINNGANFATDGAGSVTFGAVTLNADASFVTGNVNGAGVGVVTVGAISEAGGSRAVSKSGAAILNITGAGSNYTGGTSVTAGILRANNSAGSATGSGAVNVSGTGTFGGDGSIAGALNVATGGSVSPGNSPGDLATGPLSLTTGSTLAIELAGNTAGSSYDQMIVNGAVNLGGTGAADGATLTVSLLSGFIPANVGDRFKIIDNLSSGQITTQFAQGSTVTAVGGAASFNITYTGGDGNDVELISLVPEPASFGLLTTAALGLLAPRRRRKTI